MVDNGKRKLQGKTSARMLSQERLLCRKNRRNLVARVG